MFSIPNKTTFYFLLIIFFSSLGFECFSQDLYTARSYWEESTKKTYLGIKQKQDQGETLSADESSYLLDYETYLANYYNRLSDTEKERYKGMKGQWDRELRVPKRVSGPEEFEWKIRDRGLLFFYGAFYGATIPLITDMEGAASVAIPLITGGLWLMGPTFNPGKYEGITQSTIRAGNTGKMLGLLNGAFLGQAIAGKTKYSGKAIMAFSTLGSIGLGELGFQLQKKQQIFDNHIGMYRHYGILGPGVAAALAISTKMNNENLVGALLLLGGATGLMVGDQMAKKYDYTRGDIAAISSLTLISTGVGFTAIAAQPLDTGSEALVLIPAVTAIAGTLLSQKSVRGVYLTPKQGSNLMLATSGAAAIGLGLAVLIDDAGNPTLLFGIPSGLALATHQILFNSYKRKNMSLGSLNILDSKSDHQLVMEFKPENYFLNKSVTPEKFNPKVSQLQKPILNLKLTF